MSKKLIAVILVLAMSAALALSAASAANFSDVNPGDQYYDAIQFVGGLDLIDAIGGAFEPGTNATRAVALTALYRLVGEPEVEFDD
ncbi:MAG: S-layer homology domain-containing protein, partial [Oscillospiraceae bacterium]|nr:S-layer homology domain-containing protein [Oscillospiraceae bacterium]